MKKRDIIIRLCHVIYIPNVPLTWCAIGCRKTHATFDLEMRGLRNNSEIIVYNF